MVMGGGVNAMTKVATAMSAAAHQPPRIVPSTSFFQVRRDSGQEQLGDRLFLRTVSSAYYPVFTRRAATIDGSRGD
jgi:hypothetical protein